MDDTLQGLVDSITLLSGHVVGWRGVGRGKILVPQALVDGEDIGVEETRVDPLAYHRYDARGNALVRGMDHVHLADNIGEAGACVGEFKGVAVTEGVRARHLFAKGEVDAEPVGGVAHGLRNLGAPEEHGEVVDAVANVEGRGDGGYRVDHCGC